MNESPNPNPHPLPPAQALAGLWAAAGLPAAALSSARLAGDAPVLPSSFAVATAAQAALGAATLAVAEVAQRRFGGPRPAVEVDRTLAALECTCHFTLDGRVPPAWAPLSGLYACADGWVRLHANFAHHRDGALRLLGLPAGEATPREAVAAALAGWRAEAFEAAAAEAGLVAAAARDAAAWAAHPQGMAVAAEPLLSITPIEGAPPAPPRPLGGAAAAADSPGGAPLEGWRVLELTRILAGPVAGRTLALHGAEVLLVNSPALPNIEALAETSRGKRSAWLDLDREADAATLRTLAAGADVFLQSYRPGALAARGFSPQALAALSPGIVVASLSAYGRGGPWAARRGFDSLVQLASGLNGDEGQAFGEAAPRALPMQILDYGAGYLLAFGIVAARLQQAQQGGSWQVAVSLAGVGRWLRSLGRVPGRPQAAAARPQAVRVEVDSGFGRLGHVPHAASLGGVVPRAAQPSVPPGTHPPRWASAA